MYDTHREKKITPIGMATKLTMTSHFLVTVVGYDKVLSWGLSLPYSFESPTHMIVMGKDGGAKEPNFTNCMQQSSKTYVGPPSA